MASSVTLRVYRFTQDGGEGLAEYRIAAAATTVLDALVEIQRAQDPKGNCTEVCRMGLSPADSIRGLRRLAVSRRFGLSR